MKKTGSQSGNRILLILTVAAVAAGGFVMLTGNEWMHDVWNSAPTQTAAVFGGWTYDQADRRLAAAALAKAGLDDYRWEEDRLVVPAAQRGEYERVLSENQALPQKPSDVKQNALDEISAFEPESRTKLRNLYSSARQLEKTIESFQQIESASVGTNARHEQTGLFPKTVVTASISVKPKENVQMTPELVSSITMAARHHLGITDNDNISVIDTVSGRSWLGSEGSTARLSNTSLISEKTRLEELWNTKFREAFSYIPNIHVTTSVELEPLQTESVREPVLPEAEMKHAIGLEFSDVPAHTAEPKEEVRFIPRSVAVSIAVPESYIRQLADQTLNDPEADAVSFSEKKEEVLAQLREAAETVLSPAGENEEGPRRKVGVSLYADLSDRERVYRPVSEIDLTETETLSEIHDQTAGGADTVMEETPAPEAADWQAVVRNLTSGPGVGYMLAVVAFAAGIGIRSLFGRRRAEKEEDRSLEHESPEILGENSAESSRPASPSPELADRPAPNPKTHPEPFPSPEPAAEPAASAERKRFRDAELQHALAELAAEDGVSEDDLDGDLESDHDDEIIAPSGTREGNSARFSAETQDGSLRDFRVDSNEGPSAGPHFPLSDSDRGVSARSFSNHTDEELFSGSEENEDRFSFLSGLNDEQLHALLTKQRSQTIALIALLASEENRSRVLGSLGNRLRAEVERRMAIAEKPDPKVVAAVEASLLENAGMAEGRSI